jgi:glycosyltransferase involved in cell wall biosynthesis
MEEHKIKFSIITATYNAAAVLPRLIKSLRVQTDQDFEWVIADGGSTDETLTLLEEAGKTLNVRIDSQPDFGIYDALNRGIRLASGDYYLVVGADDELFSAAVAEYKLACSDSGADFITAKIEAEGKIQGVRERRWEWLYGQFAYVSAHAVGLAIRRGLHEKYGFYSRKFPIAADQLFVLQVVRGGGKVRETDFVAGRFCPYGASGEDYLGSLLEGMRVRCLLGHGLWLQMLILAVRLARASIRI